MADTKNILILGGGYGGVWAGKILEKRFRKDPSVKITLVDRKPYHTLMTELHEVAGWRTDPESVQVSFRKIFGAKRIDIVVDDITAVDFAGKKATGKARSYDFDYIVVGAGAEPEFFNIPGVKENCFTLWSFDDAMKIRHHLEHTFAKAAEETDEAKRRRMLTFVVAGAGFTGIEMVGELLEYRDVMCVKHHIPREETRVINIEALPSILPILEEPLRVRAEKYLAKLGCEVILNASITGAEPGKVLCKDGTLIETDTFIWTCGVKGSSFAAGLSLTKAERGRGRIQVDDEMKSVDHPHVYVVGDNAFFLEDGKPVPQIVEGAHQTAEVAAKNIIAAIEGSEHRHQFKSNFHGFMVSLGGRYGVANAGGMKTHGFFAMVMKHMINMWYLFNIAGFNQVWEYAKHEFLDIQNRRSIIGGFAVHKTRAYWSVLLRMWLGLMWLFEGINKIGEGWLAWGSGTKSGWMFSSGVTQAGMAKAAETVEAVAAASGEWAEPAAEAVSAASGAAEAAVEAVTAASGEWVEGAAEAVAEVAVGAADAAGKAFGKVWDLSKPIYDFNGPISTWFRTTFMDGIFAHLPFQAFQLMIVVMEIAIGLALFGGFFTWFAAVASIAMCVIFTLSGMFAWDQLWFVFAAILMMGGAGRAFGMDYWSVPFFKKWWNGTRLARKWHFYADDPTK
ncbi:MAG TPA: NAD(P)/FAD-dependent oxidoreductase [Spirochaetales bacterium]|nr:NAD(P)/FAD-dependent oxidoreductase [Spirochaetales bacterium]